MYYVIINYVDTKLSPYHRHFYHHLLIIFIARQIFSDPIKFSRQPASGLVRVRCLIDNRARVSREKRLSHGKAPSSG